MLQKTLSSFVMGTITIAVLSSVPQLAAAQVSGGTCVTATSNDKWMNTAISPTLSGTFTAQFDATPSASPLNAVVALSKGSQTDYTGFATLVRFNTSGDIDAYNGTKYAAASTIKFAAGTTYHFREVVNASAHTYSIYVTGPSGTEQTLGSNYAFRSEQKSVSSITSWAVQANSSNKGSLTACFGGGSSSSSSSSSSSKSSSSSSSSSSSVSSSSSSSSVSSSSSSSKSSSSSSKSSSSSSSSSTGGAWTGNFDGFNTPAWGSAWGVAVPGDAESFGQNDPGMAAFTDPTSPDGHQVLKVSYKAHSTARSCGASCPLPDGGQFYQKLTAAGRVDLANAQVLHMRYYVKFGPNPDGSAFDFGKAGKMPGLWGGVEGQESGCVSTTQGWSTRSMWRGPNKAELYLYPPAGNAKVACGNDTFWGNTTWAGDGKWHYVEQAIDRTAGTINEWYDGQLVLSNFDIGTGYNQWPISGILFSTFYGGHDTSWGPQVDTTSYFAKFTISTTYIGP